MQVRWVTMLFLFNSVLVSAGFGDKAPVKWGKVAISEFEVQMPDGNEDYHAIVLCDYGAIEVTNRSMYSRHIRIRIQDEEGLSYGRVEIPYQTRDNHDDFTRIQAQTMLLRNGKTVVIKADRQQISDIKIDDNWSKKIILFPEVEVGAIIEYRYTLASLDFEKLDEWYFQREIPTLWSEVRFQVPTSYVYLVTFQNNRRLSFAERRIFGESLQWLYDTNRRERQNELANRENLLFQTLESRYKVWVMNDYKKKIIMRNLPGLADSIGERLNPDLYPKLRMDLFESYGNLPPIYRPLLITTSEDYPYRSRRQMMYDRSYVSGYIHYRLKTWMEMNNDLLEHERFGRMLIRNTGEAGFMESITPADMPARDRITVIYDYIQNNFHWNGNYSMYATMDMNDIIEGHTGASADLNLLMINMFRRAGLEADPLLIRTTDLGQPEKMFPVSNQFNHVIAMVYVNGQQILLDATTGPSRYSMLNSMDVGTSGWAVSSRRPGWIEVYSSDFRRVMPLNEENEAPQFSM